MCNVEGGGSKEVQAGNMFVRCKHPRKKTHKEDGLVTSLTLSRRDFHEKRVPRGLKFTSSFRNFIFWV